MTASPPTVDQGAAALTGARPAGPPPTTRFRRYAGAAALVVAPWGFVLANLSYALSTKDGGDDATGAHAIALSGAHPGLTHLGVVSGMVGCLLVVPALLAAMRLLRRHSARLSLFAGASMIAGYCCYLGGLTQSFVVVAMADRGAPIGDYAAVLDASQNDASGIWAFVLFAFGNLIGTLLLAIAMFRSRALVPWWAAVAVAAWPVLHVTGLSLNSEWYEVAGAVSQAVGLAALAVVALRTSDAEWSRLG